MEKGMMCGICGHKSVTTTFYNFRHTTDPEGVLIECPCCGAKTSVCQTKEKAAKEWQHTFPTLF